MIIAFTQYIQIGMKFGDYGFLGGHEGQKTVSCLGSLHNTETLAIVIIEDIALLFFSKNHKQGLPIF